MIKYGIPIAAAVTQKFWHTFSTIDTTRKKETSGVGVTSQYDKKTVYYKKNMPRYKKRKWIGFVKKTNAAFLKGLGTKTVVRNTQLYSEIASADIDTTQGILHAVIYGADGTPNNSNAGVDDLVTIFVNDAEISKPTDKAHFASAILDATISNVTFGGDTAVGNYGAQEVDVYEFVCTKTFDAPNIGNLFTQAQTNTENINGAGAPLLLANRGATPFDFPDALSRGYKILKKTKYFLAPGQSATYQMRDPGNKIIRRDNIDDNDVNAVRRYLTRGITVVHKNVPTGIVATGKPTPAIRMGVTRKYMYKVQQTNEDQDQYL